MTFTAQYYVKNIFLKLILVMSIYEDYCSVFHFSFSSFNTLKYDIIIYIIKYVTNCMQHLETSCGLMSKI